MNDLLAAMTDVDEAGEIDYLRNALSEYLVSCGVSNVFYRHIPLIADDSFDSNNIFVKGCPKSIIDRYIDGRFYESDIVQMQALTLNRTYDWFNIEVLQDTKESQIEFINLLAEYMGDNILVLPVYGTSNRSGYFCLGFENRQADINSHTLRKCQIICNYAHMVYTQYLTRKKPFSETLSARELEIIRWVARGKSNSVIGDIVGISRHTVDSYLRRIFIKLEATDRTTAALKALNMGLIIS